MRPAGTGQGSEYDWPVEVVIAVPEDRPTPSVGLDWCLRFFDIDAAFPIEASDIQEATLVASAHELINVMAQ